MSKRKSRGSRETSKLLEQMGIDADDEAPAEPQVLPEANVLPTTSFTANTAATPSPTASASAGPSPAKPRPRAALWALIIALLAAAGGAAAFFVLHR